MPVERSKRGVPSSRPDVGDHSPVALKRGRRPSRAAFQNIVNGQGSNAGAAAPAAAAPPASANFAGGGIDGELYFLVRSRLSAPDKRRVDAGRELPSRVVSDLLLSLLKQADADAAALAASAAALAAAQRVYFKCPLCMDFDTDKVQNQKVKDNLQLKSICPGEFELEEGTFRYMKDATLALLRLKVKHKLTPAKRDAGLAFALRRLGRGKGNEYSTFHKLVVRDAVRGVCEYLSEPQKWVVVLDSREKLSRTCVQDMHCIFAAGVRGFCESQGWRHLDR